MYIYVWYIGVWAYSTWKTKKRQLVFMCNNNVNRETLEIWCRRGYSIIIDSLFFFTLSNFFWKKKKIEATKMKILNSSISRNEYNVWSDFFWIFFFLTWWIKRNTSLLVNYKFFFYFCFLSWLPQDFFVSGFRVANAFGRQQLTNMQSDLHNGRYGAVSENKKEHNRKKRKISRQSIKRIHRVKPWEKEPC
jgi:hypothetical protein